MEHGNGLMKFNLLVNEGPYTHQASDSAYLFTQAVIESGHEVVRVFFYHDGVYNSTRLGTPPIDDRNVMARWTELAKEYEIDMVVCVAAGQRRGMLDEEEAKRFNLDSNNVHQNFKVAGLGQFIEGSILADRTIVFGD